tara:strand:- start:64 stop:1053 length:990 start_codon:yes stop_codon:yes gene_type:complete
MSKIKTPIKHTEVKDLLDEDTAIAGQKFVCVSFISPEDIIKKKEIFFFENYVKTFDLNLSLSKYNKFLNFISYKYKIDIDDLQSNFNEFCSDEKSELFDTTLEDNYKNYIDVNEEQLLQNFNELYDFKTSVRGVKIRGSFSSQQEAEIKAKQLRDNDKDHDVYVGQVGLWLPFHPQAYKTGKVDYLNNELNELMNYKKDNDDVNKEKFDNRVKETKIKAINENIEKAKKNNNKLMQSIDENGNLINADRMDVPGKNLLYGNKTDDPAVEDLRNELFNSDNVIIGIDKDSDHGLSAIKDRHPILQEQTTEQTTDQTTEQTSHQTTEQTPE